MSCTSCCGKVRRVYWENRWTVDQPERRPDSRLLASVKARFPTDFPMRRVPFEEANHFVVWLKAIGLGGFCRRLIKDESAADKDCDVTECFLGGTLNSRNRDHVSGLEHFVRSERTELSFES